MGSVKRDISLPVAIKHCNGSGMACQGFPSAAAYYVIQGNGVTGARGSNRIGNQGLRTLKNDLEEAVLLRLNSTSFSFSELLPHQIPLWNLLWEFTPAAGTPFPQKKSGQRLTRRRPCCTMVLQQGSNPAKVLSLVKRPPSSCSYPEAFFIYANRKKS